MALLLALLLAAADARAAEVSETPRLPSVPALSLPAGRMPGAAAGSLSAPSLSIADVLSWRKWGQGAALPGLAIAPPLAQAAGPNAQASPAPLASEGAAALPALGIRVVPDGVSAGRLPASAAQPASLPSRFAPSPLAGGTENALAASSRRQPGLSALSRQAAQTLADVRALPASAPNEGAWRLARRLWDGDPRRGADRAPRLDDARSGRRGGLSAGSPRADGGEGARADAAGAEQGGRPAQGGGSEAIYATLAPAGPRVVGRRVAPVDGAPLELGGEPWAASAAFAARPPIALVALRVAGQSLLLTERLEPLPASPAATAAAEAAVAMMPAPAALDAPGAAPSDAGAVRAAGSGGEAAPLMGSGAVSAAASMSPAPSELWALAETAPLFDAGDPGPAKVRAPQPSEASLSPISSSGRAASQPWAWLLPVGLLAFRYRREFL